MTSNPTTPSADERTPQDYAIEHAEYMAVKAERLLDAVQEHASAHLALEDDGNDPDSDEDISSLNDRCARADEGVTEAMAKMRDGIDEFRKRRDRAALAASQAASHSAPGLTGYPPLPEPVGNDGYGTDHFDADDMRAYADAHLASHSAPADPAKAWTEERAKVAQELAALGWQCIECDICGSSARAQPVGAEHAAKCPALDGYSCCCAPALAPALGASVQPVSQALSLPATPTEAMVDAFENAMEAANTHIKNFPAAYKAMLAAAPASPAVEVASTDVCTDPNNCNRCKAHPNERNGLGHAGISVRVAGDFTGTHAMALQPKSGIEVCTNCGRGPISAKKHPCDQGDEHAAR